VTVVEEGELRHAPVGRRLHVRPAFDASVTGSIKAWFEERSTVQFANYAIGDLRDAPSPLRASRGGV
jgi:hypothetical protein